MKGRSAVAKDINRIFNQMVNDMHTLAPTDDILDACMSFSQNIIRQVPLRYRIIALGFVSRYTLDELNEKLVQNSCPKLYSRNFWEATLIFAFLHGYTYEQWRQLQVQCADLYARAEKKGWLNGSKITYAELERYVQENSDESGDLLATQMQTQIMERGLIASGDSVEDLRVFLTANLSSFSAVRERTRYYFCKYLYYYLNRRIENYFNACRLGRGVEEALSELLTLKAVTQLRRNLTRPEAEKRALIRESAISCGEIFDTFNYFYFGYVSTDWVQILMECYERVEDIPSRQKQSLAGIFRRDHADWKALSDDEVIRRSISEVETRNDEAYARDGNRGYGKNRAGENALRKYIQGTLDIDRTVLICFLLFFASDAMMPDTHRLTPVRLDEILNRCGYAALDIEQDFDWFATEFLESKHPLDFLDEVIVGYARQQENSFLYHIYGGSVHYEDELLRVMIPASGK